MIKKFESSVALIHFNFNEINKLRTNPKCYEEHFQKRLPCFCDEKTYYHSEISTLSVKTIEGPSAVKEAILALDSQPAANALNLSFFLCSAADKIGIKMAQEDNLMELKSFKEELHEMIQKENPYFSGTIQVLVEYGFRKNVECIMSIFIDDGDQTRSRRKILLNSFFQYIGIGVHEHKEYDYILIIFLTDENPEVSNKCQLI